jgi:hypothetical protein
VEINSENSYMAETAAKHQRFRTEICDKYCKLCGPKANPSFCAFLFEANPRKFLTTILLPIIVAHRKMPKILPNMDYFEGFRALFCDRDESLCKQFRSPNCRGMPDCYQTYLSQKGVPVESADKIAIMSAWDSSLYSEMRVAFNQLDNFVSSTMKAKKRKKLFRILNRLANIFRDIGNSDKNSKGDAKKAKEVKTHKKKEVTTRFFARWEEPINKILERKEDTCESKSEAVSA